MEKDGRVAISNILADFFNDHTWVLKQSLLDFPSKTLSLFLFCSFFYLSPVFVSQ